MTYLSPIDPHVHLRWNEYPDDNFAAMALLDAKAVGLAAMCEMPNTNPALTDMPTLQKRRVDLNDLADAIGCEEVSRFIHIGITNDFVQVRRALEWIQHRNDQHDMNCLMQEGLPIADKTFYTHSTGNMGLLEEDTQKKLWELKAKIGYKGVSIGHFEDEKKYVGGFDYTRPETHSRVQCPMAEVAQVHRQLNYAMQAGFKGTFYIAHVSTPETVELVQQWKRMLKPDFKIVMEVTWHHMFLNTNDYVEHGNLVKMNPPIRTPDLQRGLLEHVVKGNIDIIGTDHAPHSMERKQSMTPPSGIPAIPFWPKGIQLLQELGVSRERIEEMTFHAAKQIFKLDVKPRMVEAEYDLKRWDKYGWNPFSRVDSHVRSVCFSRADGCI